MKKYIGLLIIVFSGIICLSSIDDIENGESGLSARTKINTGFHYINDTIPAMIGDSTQSAKDYTDSEISDNQTYFTVNYYYQLLLISAQVGSKAYVAIEDKEYIYDGINWDLLISDNIILNDKKVQQIYDYRNDLKSINNYGITGFTGGGFMGSGGSNRLGQIIMANANDGILSGAGLNNLGNDDIWILIYNNDFEVDTFLRIGTVDQDYRAYNLIDDDDNLRIYFMAGISTAPTVYINGFYNDTIDTYTGNTADIYYMSFDQNLDVVDSANLFMYGTDIQILEDAVLNIEGNIYIMGYHRGTSYLADTSFDSQPALYTPYYCKLNQDNEIIWLNQLINDHASTRLIDVEAAIDGKLYYSGHYRNNLQFPDLTFTISSGFLRAYVVQVDPDNGNGIKYKRFESDNISAISDMTINNSDNSIYVTGYSIASYLTCDDITVSLTVGTFNQFIAKFDSTLTCQWINVIKDAGTQAIPRGVLYNDNLVYSYYLYNKTCTYEGNTITHYGTGLNYFSLVHTTYGELIYLGQHESFNNTVDASRGFIFKDKINNRILEYKSVTNDSITVGNDTIDLSTYPTNYFFTEFGVDSLATSLLHLTDAPIIIGDYYEGVYANYEDSTFEYINPPVNFSGNEIPSVIGIQNLLDNDNLTIGVDAVNDTHIDWGTGTNQVSTADIPEETNLYYTEGRVSANTDVSANTSARHSVVTTSGTPDYITLSGQDIIRGQVDLSTDVTGSLPYSSLSSQPNIEDTIILNGHDSITANSFIQVWDSVAHTTPQNLNFHGTDYKYIYVTGIETINITGLPSGESILYIEQDGTGYAITKGTGWGTLMGTGTISSTADAETIIQFMKVELPGGSTKIRHFIISD